MFKNLISKELIEDRRVLVLVSINLFLMLINVVYVLIGTNSYERDIAVRYTQRGASEIILGEWYTLYEFAIFAVVATVINMLLALRLRSLRRELTVIITLLNIVVMVFLFVVARALFGQNQTG